MKPARIANLWFVLALTGLFSCYIGLSYFQPSSWLPQASPDYEFASSQEQLNGVLQLADNWRPAHEAIPSEKNKTTTESGENKEVKTVVPPLPTKEIVVEPSEPPHPPEHKTTQTEQPATKEEAQPQKIVGYSTQSSSFWFILFVIIFSIVLLSLSFIALRVAKVFKEKQIEEVKLGVRKKGYTIAENFQHNPIQEWLEEAEKKSAPLIEETIFGAEQKPAKKPFRKRVREAIVRIYARPEKNKKHPSIASYTPNIRLGWDDVWAFLLPAFSEIMLAIFWQESTLTVKIIIATILYIPVVAMLIALFRQINWARWVFGVVGTFLTLLTCIITPIYFYYLEHPKAMNQQVSGYVYLYVGIGIVTLILLGQLNKRGVFKNFYHRFIKGDIWLYDQSSMNIGLLYLVIGIFTGAWFLGYGIGSPFYKAAIISGVLWINAPTLDKELEQQWKIRGGVNLLIVVAAAAAAITGEFYDFYFNDWIWALAIVAAGMQFSFYRTGDYSKLAKKDKKEKQDQKKATTTEKINSSTQQTTKVVKKIVQKNIPKLKTPINNWWKLIDEPSKTGLLHLENHGLSTSSDSLKHLMKFKNLHHLYLSNNFLDQFPVELVWMKDLRKLDLNDNSISFISPMINELKDLRILELANNEIRTLPGFLAEHPSLKIINLKGNPLASSELDFLRKKAPHLTIEY